MGIVPRVGSLCFLQHILMDSKSSTHTDIYIYIYISTPKWQHPAIAYINKKSCIGVHPIIQA